VKSAGAVVSTYFHHQLQRIATIDIGTNTALLLIADLDAESNSIRAVFNHQEIIRLGKGVDGERRILPESIGRMTACLSRYQTFIQKYEAKRVRAVATSAVRDAKNRDEVLRAARETCNIDIELLSGDTEAELTFIGAVAGWTGLPEPFLVIDIGGGSTELILGEADKIFQKVSIDVGSVRLTERLFNRAQPPSAKSFEAARQFLAESFAKEISRFISGRESVIAVAGTAVTLAQQAQNLATFENDKLHGFALSYSQVDAILAKFKVQSIEQIAANGVEQGRADVITAGALILWEFMRVFGSKQVTISTQGLRYGVAVRELRRAEKH
jgi:exopolyphosphatase/guanosine-5'-triphosphate,3'-diphosphate pyrophosphatase